MKNLINRLTIQGIEEGDTQSLSPRLYNKEREIDSWHYKAHESHTTDGVSPRERAERVIKKFMGKSFNNAFSYYCSLVPKYQQKYFLEQFEKRRVWYEPKYTTNSQGVIKDNRRARSKQQIYFTSDDYATEYRHKLTGHKKNDFTEVYEKIPYEVKRRGSRRREDLPELYEYYDYYTTGYRNGKFLYYEYGVDPLRMKPLNERYTADNDDFEVVIVRGWCLHFKTKDDPLYKRLHYEKMKSKGRNNRLWERQKAEKQYNMLAQSEIALRKEKEQNEIKILSHGFDLETSFRK